MVELKTRSWVVFVALILAINSATLCNGGTTSRFVRKIEESHDMPLDSDVFREPPGYNPPQQVHITLGDHEGKAMIISWVTVDEVGSSKVIYWIDGSNKKLEADGKITSYKFYNYSSGYIHHCSIKHLKHNTKYHYEVGIGHTVRSFWFMTPSEVGPDTPYTFGLLGDLGQTYDSNITLTHHQLNKIKGQAVLYVGDLSYADNYPNHDNVRWDTWGRFVERIVAYQPWIWTVGNHELDYVPEIGETEPFKPFSHRYHTPYKASNSTSPFWYSIKRGKYTPQYDWLEKELPKVDRTKTPWLIVLLHSPWYSNHYHFIEGETMRVMFESWFVQYKVDLVFAGHVHAYERWERISNIAYDIDNGNCTPVKNSSAPIYVNIGDGGNIEGLSLTMREPQPKYSAFREASFGHATLDIKNRTRAYYAWHRNQDGYAVEADTLWINNRYWHPVDESTTHTSTCPTPLLLPKLEKGRLDSTCLLPKLEKGGLDSTFVFLKPFMFIIMLCPNDTHANTILHQPGSSVPMDVPIGDTPIRI